MLLLGKQINKLDQRRRVFVPAKFRDALGDEFVVTISGEKKCIQCFSEAEFENKFLEIQEKIGEMIDEDSLVMDLFSEAATVEVDVKGRITIPETHMKEMDFEGEVLIIGMGKHVEIWKEETFNEYKNKSQKAVQMVKDADALMREAHIMKRISDANALKKSTEG
ncbi:MAG: hypothetical protein E7558_00345 [Ruminococcaceae bacterium]|nr:hypothetical protein [Oscillospiraceae bacterium]MBQ6873389.1 hypothetical protein [Clostridia bacterium]